MSSDNSRRPFLWTLPVISIVIAVMSLASSFFQSFNYSRNIDVAQRNVLRAESLRTCKEIIEAYFQFRLAAMEESEAATQGRGGAGPEPDARLKSLVFKFGALGTFLANFREDQSRERYTQLTGELTRIAGEARTTKPAAVEKLFEKADAGFAAMNDDCVAVTKLFGVESAR